MQGLSSFWNAQKHCGGVDRCPICIRSRGSGRIRQHNTRAVHQRCHKFDIGVGFLIDSRNWSVSCRHAKHTVRQSCLKWRISLDYGGRHCGGINNTAAPGQGMSRAWTGEFWVIPRYLPSQCGSPIHDHGSYSNVVPRHWDTQEVAAASRARGTRRRKWELALLFGKGANT